MAENIIESTVEDDGSKVKSLRVTIDEARLLEIQNVLEKGGRDKSKEFAGLNAFINNHLNKIDGLRARAATLRSSQSQEVTIANVSQVGGVSIPVEQSSDPVITAHNEEVGRIDTAIREFNQDRTQFLTGFIAKYVSRPAPTRGEPVVGTRGPQRPAGDDMFSQGIRESARGPKPTRADAPDIQAGRNQIAGAVASALGLRKPPTGGTGGVLDANGNLRAGGAAETAFEFAGTDRYVPNPDKK